MKKRDSKKSLILFQVNMIYFGSQKPRSLEILFMKNRFLRISIYRFYKKLKKKKIALSERDAKPSLPTICFIKATARFKTYIGNKLNTLHSRENILILRICNRILKKNLYCIRSRYFIKSTRTDGVYFTFQTTP